MVDTQITVYNHRRRSTTPRQRRSYTREFKVEAVKLVTQKGYSVAEAARSLDIGETLLRSWKQAFDKEGDQAFPGHGQLTAIERRPSSPRRRCDLLLHRAAPGPLAHSPDVRHPRGFLRRLLRLAVAA